jgi:hypothetical protein
MNDQLLEGDTQASPAPLLLCSSAPLHRCSSFGTGLMKLPYHLEREIRNRLFRQDPLNDRQSGNYS